MSATDFSLASLNPIGPVDLSPGNLQGLSQQGRIEKVSKAMEALFVNQLTAELGKGIDGSDDPAEGQYGDFIQQAMTQGVTQGGGLGLAKIIEQSLSKITGQQTQHPAPMTLKTPTTSYHVNQAQ
jgi:Rod binding domain-containing protein